MDRTADIRRPAGESDVLRDDAQRTHLAAVADFHVDPDDRADADRHVTPYADVPVFMYSLSTVWPETASRHTQND